MLETLDECSNLAKKHTHAYRMQLKVCSQLISSTNVQISRVQCACTYMQQHVIIRITSRSHFFTICLDLGKMSVITDKNEDDLLDTTYESN